MLQKGKTKLYPSERFYHRNHQPFVLLMSRCWHWKKAFSLHILPSIINRPVLSVLPSVWKEEVFFFFFFFLTRFDLCLCYTHATIAQTLWWLSGAAAWISFIYFFSICVCSLKCHSFPLKPINWGCNGTEFLSIEPLMNASEPLRIRWITMRVFTGREYFIQIYGER